MLTCLLACSLSCVRVVRRQASKQASKYLHWMQKHQPNPPKKQFDYSKYTLIFEISIKKVYVLRSKLPGKKTKNQRHILNESVNNCNKCS